MKRFFYAIIISFIGLLHTQKLSAQLIGENVFLKGEFVEVGINKCGAFGSPVLPPAGYHPTLPMTGLGFVADWESDGWDVGTPFYCGDYFVPGSPVEGWQVQIGPTVWTNTDQACSPNSVPGAVTDYSYAGGVYSGTWVGNISSGTTELEITAITTLPEDKLYFVTRILLCNNGDEPLVDVYYKRNVDPDNDQPWSGLFTTDNIIVYQPPIDEQALVTSEGGTYGCFLGIGARDENSRVSFGNFLTQDGSPQDVYEATAGYSGTGSEFGDIANSISFYIDTIFPGECRCVAFAYILNPDDLEEALEATVTYNITVDEVTVSAGDTAYACNVGQEVNLSVLGADDYFWTWSPSEFLDIDTGVSVTATITETTTFTAVGVGGFCGDANISVTIVLDESEFAFAGNDTAICLGDVALLHGDGGPEEWLYNWVPETGLDCADCQDPVYLPTEPGEYTLTFTSTNIFNCPATDEIVVTVNALPVVDAGDDTNVCPEGEVQLEATGAVEYTWSPSTGLDCDDCPDPTTTVNDNTTYTVTGIDENGCINTDEVFVSVYPALIIDAVPDEITIDVYLGETVQLDVSGAETYVWTPPTGLSDPNIANPIANPSDTTVYMVTGTDEFGCQGVDFVIVNVIAELTIGVPTAFSPNGDGINDFWTPMYSGSGFLDSYVIYNRWGELVFEGSADSDGWNGEFEGKVQEIGTYTVVIKAHTTLNEPQFITGNFTLVK